MTELAYENQDSQALLEQVAETVLAEAKKLGASAAETSVSQGRGLSVTARMGEVETVEHNRDKSLVINVYFGQRSGSASTSDFSSTAIKESVTAACTIAKYTGEDPCHGLADPERLAKNIPELDLYHPWNLSLDQAIELATECEQSALELDSKITNSEGATIHSHDGIETYANSHSFIGTVASSRHGISCAVIGQTENGMQRDYWYCTARDAEQLDAPDQVGRIAGERTLRRLDARQMKTTQAPVLFEAPLAAGLLSHLVGAIRGSALYRKSSFLLDHLDKQIFPANIRIHEQPHLLKASGSAAYDNEGVGTQARDIVNNGILKGYVLDSYSARKLGMETTGNAGGVHNLTIDSGDKNLSELIKTMGKGLLVTELIGYGVNNVTGDYSRGAAGFWVENGEIQYPVEEITIAGNLKDMFMGIAEVGNDIDTRRSTLTGSILVDNMTIAGS